MKKQFLCFAGALFLIAFLSSAAAQAPDISEQTRFEARSNQRYLHRLTDRNYKSAWSGSKGQGALDIISPTPIHGLYICWQQQPRAFSIQTISNNQVSATNYIESAEFVHQYYPLQGQTHIRLVPELDNGKNFSIEELFVLGNGDVPSWVQQWQPSHEDADLMLLFAHPDDEVLFFGGLLPYYAKERGLKVLPVLFTDAGAMRRSELLNSLWSLGIEHYPVMGSFPDLYANNLEHAYKRNGKRKSNDFLTEIIRKHRPEVVVTHDIRGEYGHGVHRLCADIAINSIKYAMDESRHPNSYQEYGPFQIKKLYLHLYQRKDRDVSIEMDWDQPLVSFSGKTGLELAVNAYRQFHLSQHRYEQYSVEPRESRHSSYRFGLYYSDVGDDILKNDFMENVVPDYMIKDEIFTEDKR
ncbi:MAG: hypothetical protein GX781_05145 [Clostridiales bacterium]|nr:hypothetical protein [Clostridiales bacterium]